MPQPTLDARADRTRSDAAEAQADAIRTRIRTGPLPASFEIALFSGHEDGRVKRTTLTWSEMVTMLTTHRERESKGADCWSAATFGSRGRRRRQDVVEVTCFVADLDPVEDWEEIRRWLDDLGLAYVSHSTHSFEPDDWRIRLVIPFVRPVRRRRWTDVWSFVNAYLFGGACDPNPSNPNAIYDLPTVRPNALRHTLVVDGLALDADHLPRLTRSQQQVLLPDRRRPGAQQRRRGPVDHAAIVAGVSEKRRRSILSLVCSLRGFGRPQGEAEEMALTAAANCHPPYDPEKALQMVKYAYRYATNVGRPPRPLSPERQAVIDCLAKWTDTPLPPVRIARLLRQDRASVRQLLRSMVQAGQIVRVGVGYCLPGTGVQTAEEQER